ncbi:NADH-quinone oxidoreductase subunit NuoG [Terrimonas pollutisoli]|uniref:NADH-quinone oxidoreductase subunit NuoG n=1 Tax=Terrimonas pollutisoli TaxID=3034147 RepID=UPI0023EAFA60|nr:NADH-quinone oxidoreductase subunit NuoG [Terrimonas sp. H1YJ31]
MPKIFIDNKPYEVKAGKNLLESCLSLGFDLPYFCWHPALGSVGACRQCAIKIFKDENDTQGKLMMSCMESVKDGLRMSIDHPGAKAFREQVIEWLMTNHPHDCPVCDEGGSCHLQDMTVMTGHDYRRFNYKKRTYQNQYLGPLIHHEMNRCIQCYRCVRFYRDYAGGDDLNVFAAHNHVYFGREKDGVLQSPFSGNLAEVCPTGVFTDKTLKEHYTRKWDLTSGPSVCQHCSLGCNVIAGERYGQLRCITNRYNSEVNGYFLCDRGRFGYEFVNSENRITQPLIRNRAGEAVNEIVLEEHLETILSNHSIIGIGSPRASVETNFSLMQLVGEENFYQGVNADEAYLGKLVVDILSSGTVHSPSLKEIEQADAVLVLGEDIWNTAPVMALAVRQSVMKTAAADATQQVPIPVWNDAAVKELVQENKGFLANCTVVASPLDEIATTVYRAAPDDIARLGFIIAHQLNPSLPPVENADEVLLSRAKMIADALQKAKHPVIISGISSYNEAVIRASFDVAAALDIAERRSGLCYILPECNSMGLAMMQASSFDEAITRVQREENITAIIVENDVYRHITPDKANTFFNRCKNIVVLDSLHNRTTEKASVLIPVSTFAEADGTLINNEGRAQRFYQSFMPSAKYIKESWKWLGQMKTSLTKLVNGQPHHPDEWLEKLEKLLPQFEGIAQSAPPHDFRIRGQLIPREPHRYSGRTAMLANKNVSEPKPLQDGDSPLTFTMEGYKGIPPGPVSPFFWSPGWNSVQSVAKYQEEVGGSLRGGSSGVRLFKEKKETTVSFFKDRPEAFMSRVQKWLLLPQYHVFGSDELSVYTRAIEELSPEPYIALSKADMDQLGVAEGSAVEIVAEERKYSLPVKMKKELCNGIALVSAGLRGAEAMNWGSWVRINVQR